MVEQKRSWALSQKWLGEKQILKLYLKNGWEEWLELYLKNGWEKWVELLKMVEKNGLNLVSKMVEKNGLNFISSNSWEKRSWTASQKWLRKKVLNYISKMVKKKKNYNKTKSWNVSKMGEKNGLELYLKNVWEKRSPPLSQKCLRKKVLNFISNSWKTNTKKKVLDCISKMGEKNGLNQVSIKSWEKRSWTLSHKWLKKIIINLECLSAIREKIYEEI